MIDQHCPLCNTVQPARVTRVDRKCAEWECSACRGRWTVKASYPGESFAFWPGDIDAALDHSLEPLFPGA